MRHRIYLCGFLLLLAGFYACDSANPVAPAGTTLTVTVNPSKIGLFGTSTITVTGFRPDGNPLNPGTQLLLTSSLGTVTPTLVEADSRGVAFATLRGEGVPGMASVTVRTASTGGGGGGGGDGGGDGGGGGATGGTSVTAMVQIGESETTIPSVAITTNPSSVSPGGMATVTVQARNADGTAFSSGARISLRSTLGTVDSEIVTNANGVATGAFQAGNVNGTATVTASMPPAAEETAEIEIRQAVVELSANPTSVPINGSSVISIFVRDAGGFSLGAGIRVRLTANRGTLDREELVTDANGEATAIFTAGTEAGGPGSVRAFVDGAEPAEIEITIRDAVDSISLIVDPRSIDRIDAGVNITLLATVLNAQSQPVPSIVVRFRSDKGSFSGTGTDDTNQDGQATEMLVVRSTDVTDIPANGTFNVTASVSSEGRTFEVTESVTVRGAPQ